MTQFLVVYRRSKGELIAFEDLGSDEDAGMRRRFEWEVKFKDDPDVEVVALGAPSREALEQTHARYFKTVRQLVAAVGETAKERTK